VQKSRLINPDVAKSCAQPSEQLVFEKSRTGNPREQQEPSSKVEEAGAGRAKRTAGNGGNMGSMKKWMLGAALAAGIVSMGAAPAQAARVGIFIGAPAVAVPVCPGPGYVWVAGYYNAGVWVPGYWNYAGVGVRVAPVIRGGVWFGHGPYYGPRYPRPIPFRR
jgi:hypothetical protein